MSVQFSGHVPSPAEVERAFLTACERRFKRAMVEVEGEARRRAPFRTGHLRRSITSTVRRSGTHFEGFVGTATLYAPFLEGGTGLYGPKHRKIVPKHQGANGRPGALRFPAGGRASIFVGGRRVQGFAGRGFRLSGQQRQGTAGARAQFTFVRSVKGVMPRKFFQDAIRISQGRVKRELEQIAPDARKALGMGR